MVTIYLNMTNLRNTETQVTIGESGTITGTKHRYGNGFHKCDRKSIYQL